MLLKIVYLPVRRILGLTVLAFRRDWAKDAELLVLRHAELGCAFESICETCTYFQTSIEFRPALQAQHDDAITRHQGHRGQLFASLLARVGQDAS